MLKYGNFFQDKNNKARGVYFSKISWLCWRGSKTGWNKAYREKFFQEKEEDREEGVKKKSKGTKGLRTDIRGEKG